MKNVFALTVIVLTATTATAQTSHSVRGYERSDGTYVPPHEQTNPNGTAQDNWSSKPNVNPYTGKEGTVDPNAPKPYNPYSPYRPR